MSVCARKWIGAVAGGALILLAAGNRVSAYNAYVAAPLEVDVFDTKTNTFTDTIRYGVSVVEDIGSLPHLAMTPDGKQIYVDGSGSSKVYVIDTNTDEITTKIDFGIDQPTGYPKLLGPPVITHDGKYVYIAVVPRTHPSNSYPTDTYSVIDTATNTIVNTITFPFQLINLSFTPDGKHAYAIHADDPTKISMIDVATNMVISTFSLQWVNTFADGTQAAIAWPALSLNITPDGARLYIIGSPQFRDNTGAVAIDTTTNAIVAKVPAPNGSWQLASGFLPSLTFTPNGQYGYLTNLTKVYVLDTRSNMFLANSIAIFGSVDAAVTPDGKYVYVDYTGGDIFEIDTATNTVVDVFADDEAGGIAIEALGAAPASKNLGMPTSSCPSACEGNPINAATGNKLQAETDFVGAPHTQLELQRYYNSQDNTASAFGPGWHSSYHRALYQRNNTTAIVTRADGRMDTFTLNAGVWQADPDVTSRLSIVLASPSNPQTGWQLLNEDDSIEFYTLTGQLSSITTRAGLVTTLSYDAAGHLTKVTGPFGHTLTFVPDPSGRVATATAPDGGVYHYAYDAHNNLISVTYPDATVRRYLYENISFPHALTSIIDELGNRFATYTYDTQDRATATQHAGGAELTTVTYNSDGTATATDARGNVHSYNFTTQFGLVKPTAVTGAPVQTAGGKAFTYDANGFLASKTDFDGNVTTYTHEARGLETSRTEAKGTALARTISTKWHPTFHLPTKITEPNRVTTFTYDPQGNLKQKTVTAGTLTRTWKYTYNGFGQVLTADGPRTDVQDVTTYSYDSKGDVATITDALGHVTSITSYDPNGRPLTIQDPNGLVTKLAYTPRGLLKSRTVGTEVTTYTYDKAENLIRVRLPDGSSLTYAYDKAHRLTGIKDTPGNLIAYTLDAAGNRTKERAFDPSNVLAQTRRHVYDEVNRLAQDIGAQNQTTTYAYDDNGNLTGVTDPLNHTTITAYDALNRLAQATDPNNGVTKFGYDANDNLVGVTDPLGNKTTYVYTSLGDQHSTTSPDTGLNYNSRDVAGNILVSTDARGQRVLYTYDALNRVTSVRFAGGTVTFTYDQGPNGIGHLTQMTDPAGQTTWEYDAHGRVLSKTQKIGTLSLIIKYGYDTSGRLASITYPSGQVITLSYTKGLVTQLAANGTPLLSSIQYEPFGPATSWFWGNGTAYIRQFDLDGRLAAYDLGPSRDRQLTYDTASRITDYTDTEATQSQHFGYDAAGQLTKFAVGNGGATTYNYDQNGNRTKWIVSNGADSYIYSPGSNRLASIAGTHPRTYTYDEAGNITGDGTTQFFYDGRGRLTQVTTSQGAIKYQINGLGQRVGKPGRFFVYDEAGRLIGEYNAQGQAIEETVYLGDMPVAVLQGTNRYFVYADQLNVPRAIMNASNGIVWRWDTGPFGTGLPTGSLTYNLRFPGQYFDSETGLSYNMARDYNPLTGRYIESDPIGLAGGINTYAYVEGNPLSFVDVTGLESDPLKILIKPTRKLKQSGEDQIADKIFDKTVREPAAPAFEDILRALLDPLLGNTDQGRLEAAGLSAGLATFLLDLYGPNRKGRLEFDIGPLNIGKACIEGLESYGRAAEREYEQIVREIELQKELDEELSHRQSPFLYTPIPTRSSLPYTPIPVP